VSRDSIVDGDWLSAVVLCLSVRPSVTRLYCVNTAKRRIKRTTPYDSPETLSFLMSKISAIFRRGHRQRGRQIEVE